MTEGGRNSSSSLQLPSWRLWPSPSRPSQTMAPALNRRQPPTPSPQRQIRQLTQLPRTTRLPRATTPLTGSRAPPDPAPADPGPTPEDPPPPPAVTVGEVTQTPPAEGPAGEIVTMEPHAADPCAEAASCEPATADEDPEEQAESAPLPTATAPTVVAPTTAPSAAAAAPVVLVVSLAPEQAAAPAEAGAAAELEIATTETSAEEPWASVAEAPAVQLAGVAVPVARLSRRGDAPGRCRGRAGLLPRPPRPWARLH